MHYKIRYNYCKPDFAKVRKAGMEPAYIIKIYPNKEEHIGYGIDHVEALEDVLKQLEYEYTEIELINYRTYIKYTEGRKTT